MKELIYKIDKDLTEKHDLLVIKILVAEKDRFSFTPLAEQPLLTKEKLNSFVSAKDASLISFLINQEVSGNTVHIPPKETLQALKLFAMNGKLHFNNKAIVIDLYGKTEFYYVLDESQKMSAFIKANENEFQFTSCDLVGKGPPRFIIKGMSLKILSTDIPWKDLKGAFEGKFRPIHELIDESKEDPEAPRVIVNTSVHTPLTIEPLPVLVLKDRLGSFADLKMDYGLTDLVSYHSSPEAKNPSVKRLPAHEAAWEKDLLETDFIKKPVGTSHYYCPLDKVAKSLAFLLEIGWQVREASGNRLWLQDRIDLQAESKTDHIAVKGKIHYGSFEADLNQIAGAFNRRERFVEIAPGHSALLPNSWEKSGLDGLLEEGEMVADTLLIKRNQLGPLASLLESQPQIRLDTDLKQLSERIHSFQGITVKEPAKTFLGCLRPYQQEGLAWLSFLHDFGFNGILADDMGLGKTVQVIAFLSTLSFEKPVLIVVPTSLIFNWKKELERFLPSVDVHIHHGSKRSFKEKQIIITTYTTLRLDFSTLSQIDYACLFLDEAQAIKNAHTQTSKAVSCLKSDFRLSITGTPIENHLMELWSHFNFLMPDLFGEEKTFAAEIQAGLSDPRFHQRIKRKVRPFLLRRRKEDVAKDLPEKIEQTIYVEMGEAQRSAYESFLSGVRSNLLSKVALDGISKHRIEVLEAIMRLRQICCHPLLIGSEVRESTKLDILLEDMETAIEEERKVLVYSQFTSMLALIQAKVKEKGWKSVYLDGSTQNREKVVTEFQENPEIKLFIISLKAGGIGLNLTAADYVFLYDPWWNNAVENQAIDRAHRIGRKETVIAKRYIVAESIEEKMMKLKAAKSALAADILDDALILDRLSGDDLLFLLS
jgi:superfamily II DNA or RNA helicase